MKVIGLIGGMSCESTAHYYARLNGRVREALGGLHSAEILMWSVDFAPIAQMQAEGRWEEAGVRLAAIARRLEGAGAEVIVLATNTMHKVADTIETAIGIPFLHIADATAEKIRTSGKRKPAIMATRFTMEQDFYTGRLREKFGLDAITPDEADRALVHQIIYDELCVGRVTDASRAVFVDVARRLKAKGADCLVLGCTEVGMLLNGGNSPLPMFDTTLIHADAAVNFALGHVPTAQAAE
ncbi:aspartate/glutamate racemase family protein [Bradyrhizobium sp. 157]|jgi:aspartate racemase|uniref:aspartate/glutamate racemase family protein n=1 Tax=Bradyrhizobium sp. 157 TaxID=2782631 RepID=UPI001FF86B42|nr:aspartate/glutamate racemase family protein [Bradyrhizobium sp. 157]MCK1638862.1 aspartate/glutamate racemase family protein [Bradyrhizobium sp. 157]